MKLWVVFLTSFLIVGSCEEKILSRKKRIDEVNEDYDQKAEDVELRRKQQQLLDG